MQTDNQSEMGHSTGLLLSVAEQLKTPLTVIARQMELADATDGQTINPRLIHSQAAAALTLVDSYLMGLQLLSSQQHLELEPVSVSSMLTDTVHQLDQYAKQYDVTMELSIAGRYEPVMANRAALQAALTSLGYALIATQATRETSRKRHIVLAGHRNAHGIVAGLYGTGDMVGAELRKALQLAGTARQPFSSLLGSSSAGVFVADALAQAMESRLRIGRHGRQSGLAMTLQPSKQLQLV